MSDNRLKREKRMSIFKNAEIIFPIGYERFHKKQLFNFQLNRPYSFGYARYDDMMKAGKIIGNFKEWEAVMLMLAEKAIEDGRIVNAAFYYRAEGF